MRSVPLTQRTAEYYSQVYAGLRRKGRPLPTNDLWIAAATMEHACPLLTFDRRFRDVEGIRVVSQPWEFPL